MKTDRNGLPQFSAKSFLFKPFSGSLGMVSDEGSCNPETAVHKPLVPVYSEQATGWGRHQINRGNPVLFLDTPKMGEPVPYLEFVYVSCDVMCQ